MNKHFNSAEKKKSTLDSCCIHDNRVHKNLTVTKYGCMEKDTTFNVNIKITKIKSYAHKHLRRARGHEVSVNCVLFCSTYCWLFQSESSEGFIFFKAALTVVRKFVLFFITITYTFRWRHESETWRGRSYDTLPLWVGNANCSAYSSTDSSRSEMRNIPFSS